MDIYFISDFVLRCTLYFTYRVFWYIWECAKRLRWMYNGTYSKLLHSRKVTGYTTSAHVLDICGRFQFQDAPPNNGLFNFLTVHNRFDHPKLVLKENVTLNSMTEDYAIFVETDENVDLTDCRLHNFMFTSQFHWAKRVIILPMCAFHSLAEELGSIETTIVFMSNTMRCGSTLVCQMLNATGKCVVLSEPEAIYKACNMIKHMDKLSGEKLVRSVVRMLFKPRRGNPEAYFLKIGDLANSMVPLIYRLYPESKHVFLYRDAIPCLQSFIRMINVNPYAKFLILLISKMGMSGLARKMAEDMNAPVLTMPMTSVAAVSFVPWAVICRNYLLARHEGVPIVGLKYEHLTSNTQAFMDAMLKHCNMTHLWNPTCLDVLQEDSQKNSYISRAILGRYQLPELTEDMIANMEAMAIELGVPPPSKPALLEGTIS